MKLNGHEQDVVSAALKLYVQEINKEIEALEAEGKRPVSYTHLTLPTILLV